MRRNAFIGFLLVFAFLSGRVGAQPTADTVWEKCFGGSQPDEGNCIVHTTDGGFAVVGSTQSNDDQVVGHHGGEDGWVVKLNAAGVFQWQKCLGGTSTDVLNAIIQTSDGGYAVAGTTYSHDGDVSGNHGGADYWVVKLNDTGGIQWEKCYGGTDGDEATSIIQTSDGGFAVGGTTTSDDGDVSGYHGGNGDFWVIKITSTGTLQWQKCLGGSNSDEAESILQNADGGYVVAGWTNSNDGDVSGNHGGGDEWVVEINDTGGVVWQNCLGGTNDEVAFSIISTSDGGFAVAGYTSSNDGDASGNHGYDDVWVVKLDLSGSIIWQKCLGGSGEDWAYSITQTLDGGYAAAGYTYSNDDEVTGNFDPQDGLEWVVKLNDTGAIQWQKCLGGNRGEQANSIIQIPGGNYVVAGTTASNDSDVSGDHGPTDIWVVELSPPDPPVISYITPDAGAPGMCVAVEIIGPANHSGNFGNGDDQPWYPNTIVALTRASDSLLVKLGPGFTSWNGRMIQQMFMIEPHTGPIDTEIYFQAYLNGAPSAVDSFRIMTPTHFVPPVGGGTLPTTGRTKGNTMVVDSMILANGTFTCPQTDPDPNTPGNQAYLPLRILSMGPIQLSFAEISADGSQGVTGTGGGNGGPGGGGGGSGYPGKGGAGFTGGGGDNDNSNGPGGTGTGSTVGGNNWQGGMSLDSIPGGTGEQHTSGGGDDGAGGGTGHPFGTSGQNSGNSSSPAGGYGAGSAGGSTANYLTNYGGGGGGNALAGTQGSGSGGNNGGKVIGNPMVIPLCGGSGGGAGNCTRVITEEGGSGGGGGGAIELTSFANISLPSSTISSAGGNGSSGQAGIATAAGGGGGSGGAVSISARDSVVIASGSTIPVQGGGAGAGQNTGGNGNYGRIRINGYVSKFASPSSAGWYSAAYGFTGPSIQRVTYSADSFFVQGFAEYWDTATVPKISNQTIEVFWKWPSSPLWHSEWATFVPNPASHTSAWAFDTALSASPIDTELYVVAVQNESLVTGTYTDVPPGIMSHTSGIIAKVTGPPQALVQPTTINFGDVLVGQCSDDTTIEVHSTGKSALSVDSAKLLGVDASQFKIVSLISQFVSPGDSLAITLQFCPDSVKCPMNATLRVFTAAGSTDISLTGCGVQPDMSIKPDTINFGRVHIGDCKDTTFIVTDTGKDPLTVTSESFGNPQFKIVDTLPVIVPAGGSKQIEIQYCPTDTLLTQSADTVRGDAPQSPIVLILIGGGKIGILSMPKIIDFGPVHLDSCKDTVVYAVNTGNDTLSLENELISTPGFSHILTVFPIVVQPDSSVPLEIQFCSTDTGSFEATMIVGTDVPSADTVLLLAHTGIGILQIANVIDFDSVAIGGCADTIIPIKNVGTDTLVLAPGTNFQPPFSYQGPSQIVLAPGATTTIQLLFCPQDTTEASETTQFDTIGSGENKIFTLRGKGIEGSLSTSGFFDLGCLVQGTSATITDTIRNIGAATLQNLGAAILPVAAAQIIYNPPSSLPPGGIDSVVLVIPATTLGTFSATLTLSWTDGTPVTVPITGQISLPPAILSRTRTIQFDSTNVGDSTVIECVQITNYSCVPMPIDSIFVPGGLANGYEIVSNSAGSTISDSAIATICLRFKPVRNGSSFDSLVVVSSGDTITISNLSAYGIGKGVGVELAVDTVAGRPGDIVNVPVRTLNDVTSASIDTVTFRVSFDPMQLDLKAPLAPTVPSIESNATPTYTVKTYSIGDKEITAAFSTPLTGTPTIAELPFEILQPTANTASIHVVSASFGASLATLSTTSDGLIQIEQCDTNDRIALAVNPIDVAQNNPNPFNERAAISVNVNTAGHLKIEVYNALGMKVLVPFDANVAVGTQTVELDASALPSGAYHYITTWTWVGSNVPSYQPTYARDEKTMILLGK